MAFSNNGLKYLFLKKSKKKISLADKMKNILSKGSICEDSYIFSVLELDENSLSFVGEFDLLTLINKYFEDLEKKQE